MTRRRGDTGGAPLGGTASGKWVAAQPADVLRHRPAPGPAGRRGRDESIGGADWPFGGAADDLLIAGPTAFDDDPAGLALIRAEWTSTTSYAGRVAHLTGQTPGGRNGTAVLTAATVQDDGAADLLTGGLGRDWYVTAAADQVVGKAADETRTIL